MFHPFLFEMKRLLYYSTILSPTLFPLRFPIVARSTNGKIYRFYFWRASRERREGRGAYVSTLIEKEGKRRIWNKAVFAIPRKGIRENISFFFFPYSRFVRIIRQYESIILPIRFLLCIVIYWLYETTQKRVDKVSFVQCLLFIGT